MDALTQLVLLVTLAAVALYALYWVVRKAVRDELAAPRPDLPRRDGASNSDGWTSAEPHN